ECDERARPRRIQLGQDPRDLRRTLVLSALQRRLSELVRLPPVLVHLLELLARRRGRLVKGLRAIERGARLAILPRQRERVSLKQVTSPGAEQRRHRFGEA